MMRLAYRNPVAFIFVIFGKLFVGVFHMVIKVMIEIIVALVKIFERVLGSAVYTMKGMTNGFRRRKSEKLKKEVRG